MTEKKGEGIVHDVANRTVTPLAKAGADYVKTVASGGTEGQALASAGFTLLQEIVQIALLERVNERTKDWLKIYAATWSGQSCLFEEAAEEQLRESLQNKSNQQTLHEAWLKARDALDPTVLPALARLTVEYIRSDRKPDAFFRGLGRMLAELDEEEFKAFQALLTRGVQFIHDAPYVAFYASPEEVGAHWMFHDSNQDQKEDHGPLEGIDPLRARRVLYLLDTNYIGQQEGRWGANNSRTASLARDVLFRLQALVNGPAPPEGLGFVLAKTNRISS